MLRDGRDVVCSLLERGWLRSGRGGGDDAGLAYGDHARFWVEPERVGEFRAASEARRAAWVWRAYVSALLASGTSPYEVRYEAMATDPVGTAGWPRGVSGRACGAARQGACGWRMRLDRPLSPRPHAGQLADVEAEAGDLLAELGYT